MMSLRRISERTKCRKLITKNVFLYVCDLRVLGSPIPCPSAPRSHLSIPRPGHWHSAAEQQSPGTHPASRKNLFSTHDHGWLRSSRQFFQSLRRPDCTLSRLLALEAEEFDWPVTQSMATPEPGCPGLHPRAEARSGLGCVTTPGSRRSCPG